MTIQPQVKKKILHNSTKIELSAFASELFIWRKYMEKLLNVENDCDGEVDCPVVMGPRCLILEEEVAADIKGLKMGKAAGPTGVVSEMIREAGGFGSRWMTDLINNIVKEGCIPDDWRKRILVSVYKGKGDPLVCGSYRAIKLLEQPMKMLERVLEKRVRCQLMTCPCLCLSWVYDGDYV